MPSHRVVAIVAAAAAALWVGSQRIQGAPSFTTEDVVLPWRTLAIHGPTNVTPFALAQVDQSTGFKGEAETKPISSCTPANPCIVQESGSDGVGEQTPAPTASWFADARLSASNMDTTIAVGKSYMLVSSRDHIAAYDKGGNLLGPKYKVLTPPSRQFQDLPFPNPFKVQSFFEPLTDQLNAWLPLPFGLPPGVTVRNGFGIDDYHDNRVLYDPYRDRFWIVSFAQQAKLRVYIERVSPLVQQPGDRICANFFDPNDPNQCGEQILWQYPAFGIARRGYLVVAVSKTADPRDGFYLYWWDGDIKDGTCDTLGDADISDGTVMPCTDVLKFGWQGADYPTVGITDEHLLVANLTAYKDPSMIGGDAASAEAWIRCIAPDCGAHAYEHAVVAPADALAAGLPKVCAIGSCPPSTGWHFAAYLEREPVTPRGLRPVTAHDAGPSGFPLFANIFGETEGKPRVIVWAFDTLNLSQPHFIRLSVDVSGYTSPGFFGVMNAVFRNGLFYTAWDHGDSQGNRVIRLVRFDFLNPANSQFVDEAFGGYNVFDDGPNYERVDYRFPGIEVNKDGHMALVYNRWFPPGSLHLAMQQQVRYSVRTSTIGTPFLGSSLIRPSRLLKGGEVFPSCGKPDCYIGPDTVGIAVDPFDDRAIWMAHIYADAEDSLSQRIAVGKVFGVKRGDIGVRPFIFDVVGPRAIRFEAALLNHGDARTPAGILNAYLSSDGVLDANDVRVGSIGFGPIEPGEQLALAGSAAIDPRTPPGAYYLLAWAQLPAEELSLENNLTPVIAGSEQLCIGPRGELTTGLCSSR